MNQSYFSDASSLALGYVDIQVIVVLHSSGVSLKKKKNCSYSGSKKQGLGCLL